MPTNNDTGELGAPIFLLYKTIKMDSSIRETICLRNWLCQPSELLYWFSDLPSKMEGTPLKRSPWLCVADFLNMIYFDVVYILKVTKTETHNTELQPNNALFMNKHFNKIFYKLSFRLFGVGSKVICKLHYF